MNAETPRYLLAPGLLRTTRELLMTYGPPDDPHEGVVLWGGVHAANNVIITTCLAPAARTTPGSFDIPFEESLRIGAHFRRAGIVYVGQVHSHPHGCGVGHSWGDDERAYLKFEGLLSVVVRDYARPEDALMPLSKAGVHRFEEGAFRRLSDDEVRDSFLELPAAVDLRSTKPPRASSLGRVTGRRVRG